MLFIAVVALVMPAVFGFAVYGHLEEHGQRVEQLSFATSVVLVLLYLLSLVFTGPHSYWGLIGAVPLLTGLVGSCPLYALLGLSTSNGTRVTQTVDAKS